MSYLVRRISRAKWDNDEYDYVNDDNSPADAITSCLKTFNNELSTWLIDDIDQLDNALLCLITGSKQESLNTIQIIYFQIDEIINRGLILEKTPGDTVISQYRDMHFDIKCLTYETLGNIKEIVLDCLRNDRCRVITKSELKKKLKKAIEEDELFEKSLLNEKLQNII
ncbi:hypothetical protein [Chishuiella changwenlii]|uniref:hypothetical protein n=1 Tax=Chishuiella changwenlii TaxID=1434701 RepID=UPI002FD9BB43